MMVSPSKPPTKGWLQWRFQGKKSPMEGEEWRASRK
jgi:hypothetical protein